MKKNILTIAIVLGLSTAAFAEYGGGLFKRGYVSDEEFYGAGTKGNGTPFLPNHNWDNNFDADGPLGSGIAVLLGLGAAYAFSKKRKD